MTKISISDAIGTLRAELQEAVANKPATGLGFDVEAIEVELQLVYETATNMGVEGGWSILGFSFGAASGLERTQAGVHTVTLSLKPQHVDPSGQASHVTINNNDPNQS